MLEVWLYLQFFFLCSSHCSTNFVTPNPNLQQNWPVFPVFFKFHIVANTLTITYIYNIVLAIHFSAFHISMLWQWENMYLDPHWQPMLLLKTYCIKLCPIPRLRSRVIHCHHFFIFHILIIIITFIIINLQYSFIFNIQCVWFFKTTTSLS